MEIEEILPQALQSVKDFQQKNPNGIIIIRGATATGKSKLSVLLANEIPSEIISADSRQIFKYMDIGTDKVPLEIREKIPHHQIDIITPDQNYTAGQRKADTEKNIQEIQKRNKLPIIVGGTGLYIDTIYKNFSMPKGEPNPTLRDELYEKEKQNPGYLYQELQKIDPEEANKLHPNSTRYLVRALEIFHTTGKTKTEGFFQQPVKWPILMLGLRREKEETNKRINSRIKQMMKDGLIEEVERLLEQGYGSDLQSMQGIGYKETVGYIQKKLSKDDREEELKRNTHHLAKKQRTRFRRYIAEGKAQPKENVTYQNFFL